jgi:hypothetical protein
MKDLLSPEPKPAHRREDLALGEMDTPASYEPVVEDLVADNVPRTDGKRVDIVAFVMRWHCCVFVHFDPHVSPKITVWQPRTTAQLPTNN